MRGALAKKHDADVDLKIGRLVRLRRKELKLTQTMLAQRLDITAQQLQKYEFGTNRLRISTLVLLAEVLHVPITYFFSALLPSVGGKLDLLKEPGAKFLYASPTTPPSSSTISIEDLDTFLAQFLVLSRDDQDTVVALVRVLIEAKEKKENTSPVPPKQKRLL